MKLLILFIFMLVVAYRDHKTYEISNRLILVGLFLGLTVTLIDEGAAGFFHTLLSMGLTLLVFGTIWALAVTINFKVIGAGDVKLFVVLCSFLSFDKTFEIIWYSVIVGGFFLLFRLKPHRIGEMFREMLYFLYYFIPGKKPESLQKQSFAPILLLTLIADYFHLFDYLFL